MRLLYVKLTGYVGLYNGLGLNEIELDFTKCKNQITVISGPNGVGKSTIINALSIMPDNNNNFVSTMNASKFIRLTDDVNIFEILINHPIDKNNTRSVTKASIKKNGVELNPNGNISSYKEIIFNEFDIDPNFMVLSKISGDNRGLGDKKPAERKKIVTSLMSSLDVYNNIYKNLNKKANIFKSYINNLSNKIGAIGDETALRSSIIAINSKIERIMDTLEQSKEKIVEAKTMISLADPDGSSQQKYDILEERFKELDALSLSLYKSISGNIDLHNIVEKREELPEVIKAKEKEIDHYKSGISLIEAKCNTSLTLISNYNTEIDKINIKKSKIEFDPEDDQLESTIAEYKAKCEEIEKGLYILGIKDINSVSKDEIDHTIKTIENIVYLIDDLYSRMDERQHKDILKYVGNYSLANEEFLKTKDMIKEINEELEGNRSLLTVALNDKNIISVLDNRPKSCKDDTCAFVAEAIRTKNKYSRSIDKEIIHLQTTIESICRKLDELMNQQLYLEEMIHILSKIRGIIDLVKSNYTLLSKFSITAGILEEEGLFSLISNMSTFNELRSLSNYRDISNDIIQYKSYKEVLQNLEAKYLINLNNKKQYQEYEDEIIRYTQQIQEENNNYNSLISEKNSTLIIIQSLEKKKDIYVHLLQLYNDWEIAEEDKIKIQSELEEMNSKFSETFKNLQKISELKELINNLKAELIPLENEKKHIETQLTLLSEYQVEYSQYKEKYDFVDKLRKYSSPTAGSIQSLFMSIYMDKTLSIVNQLLGLMFNGNYSIIEYVINEDEFRIPFIGNGLPVDDISSGSTSQVCIMSMIINLVLANISSSKYNIISLDEIDGGLDHENRYLFVEVLQKICNILDIGQLFIISHSVESALNNVDVVLLSDNQEYKDQFANANIIYQFERR